MKLIKVDDKIINLSHVVYIAPQGVDKNKTHVQYSISDDHYHIINIPFSELYSMIEYHMDISDSPIPLTKYQLYDMDGERVWVVDPERAEESGWHTVDVVNDCLVDENYRCWIISDCKFKAYLSEVAQCD